MTAPSLAALDSATEMLFEVAMGASQADLVATGQAYLYPNYRQAPLVVARGEGAVLWDVDGKRYLDMVAGVAVSSLGHAHPALVRAISEQAARVIQTSNYYYNEPNVLLAKKLCELTGMARAFFCNSGTEAIEASLKLVRRHYFARGQKDRTEVIAFHNAFHGRTLGALAATGTEKYREGFGPLPGATHVDYGDLDAVKRAFGPHTAAVIVEPVQGEGGVIPAPPGFLAGLRALCDEAGALLVLDEIQTGIGRTGTFLASTAVGVRPDVLALAKGLGGGVPIGSMLTRAELAESLPPGTHGSTFGGNPLASAAALAVLETLERERLLEHVQSVGPQLARGLLGLVQKHGTVVEGTRGSGLLQAIVLREHVDTRSVVGDLARRGLLVSIAGGRALRFSPPLVVTLAVLHEALGLLDETLSDLAKR
jgi:acetylornithine/N-succinyldiaminopimelate aminotransferase